MFCHRREDTLSMCDSNYHKGTSFQGRNKEQGKRNNPATLSLQNTNNRTATLSLQNTNNRTATQALQIYSPFLDTIYKRTTSGTAW